MTRENRNQKQNKPDKNPVSSFTVAQKRSIYPGVLLTGMSVITLEIAFTRIFSISLWHHFAFLSISIALFGMGVSGVFLSIYPRYIGKNLFRNLYRFSILLSFSILLVFFVFTRMNLDIRNLAQPVNLMKFALFYLLLALPFFWAGCVMSGIMARKSLAAQKIYFFDLVGAGLGCMAVVFMISVLGGQGMVLFSSILSSAAGVSFVGLAPTKLKKRVAMPVVLYAVGLVIILPAARWLFPIPLAKDKALYHYTVRKNARIIQKRWNSFSRVEAFFPVLGKMWGLSENFPKKIPEQIGITIDGDGFTSIVRFDGNLEEIEYPLYSLNSMVHALNRNGSSLIIGSGGGVDVLSALKLGASEIDAVEINPSITDMVTGSFRKFSGDLFFQPGVNLYTAEGRNFIKRTEKKYDLLYLPLVDSWAATYSGAYSLSENFLYTVEAFQDYYSQIKKNGYVGVSRWEYKMPLQPIQTYRICAIASTAVNKDLRKSVVVTSAGILVNIIWKKGEFTERELSVIKEFCNRGDFDILYMPGMENDFAAVLNPKTRSQFIKKYPLDISPVYDDRPYFYLTDRWEYAGIYLRNFFQKGKPLPIVFTISLTIIAVSIIFGLIFILLPLYLKLGEKKISSTKTLLFLAYFSLLGPGFMILELAVMSKFTLYLGNPTYSLSVMLFCLLFFSGLGSYLSSLVKIRMANLVAIAVSGIAVIGLIYYGSLDNWLMASLKFPIFDRVLFSVAIIAPVAVCMGIPYPTGLKLLGLEHQKLVPWAWGVNGSSSVLGSVTSLVLSQTMGFWKTLLFALAIYILALVVFMFLSRNNVKNSLNL